MNDDWRLRIDLKNPEQAQELAQELEAHELEEDAERSMHDRVIVSVDGSEVFGYAGTREQAEDVGKTIEALATNHGWQPMIELRHWHPTAEEWEDPATPLPQTDADEAQERRERMAQERADSIAQGYPEFEVRLQCDSHGHATELADKLRDEGMPVVQRWKAVLVGATDEDSANALADRLRVEAGPGCTVSVEGNMRDVYENRPWRPYSLLGGLGG
jgi:hypothetical protein